MRKAFFLVLISLFFIKNNTFAQSKKDIKKNKIKALTETITTYENGKEVSTITDISQKFNKDGEVIEETNFDKSGKIKSKTMSKFNNLGDKTEEIVQNGQGKQVSKETYKYDSDGAKVEETTYNDKNEVESRSVYTNKNGLRIERKKYDEKGKLIEVKKYVYQ